MNCSKNAAASGGSSAKKSIGPYLGEIASYGIYAPTHAFHLRVVIVDDESLITSLDQAIVENCRLIYNLAYRLKVAGVLAGWFGFREEMTRARPKAGGRNPDGSCFP